MRVLNIKTKERGSVRERDQKTLSQNFLEYGLFGLVFEIVDVQCILLFE